MAAQGPVQQVLRVFETIDAHFKVHPELLNTDGIFRISSAGRKHIDLAEAIQDDEKLKKIDWNQYSAHDCANALKYVLLQVRLLPAADERVKNFMATIQDPEHRQEALMQLIDSLINNENEQQIATIVNIMLDICRRTTLQEKYNRMSPLNLSVVWGPALQHCFNMEPEGDDLMAQVFFTMNLLNPAVEAGIQSGLAKVVPEIVGLRKRTLAEAAEIYQGSQTMLNIAGQKMGELRQQQMELQKILEIKESLLKKGGLKHKEKKELKNDIIPKYKNDIEALGKQIDNWKNEAKRHLNYVTFYQERNAKMNTSVDRLESMLSDMTPSDSDDDNSIHDLDADALFNHSPIMTVQYDQQNDNVLEQETELARSSPSVERARSATL